MGKSRRRLKKLTGQMEMSEYRLVTAQRATLNLTMTGVRKMNSGPMAWEMIMNRRMRWMNWRTNWRTKWRWD